MTITTDNGAMMAGYTRELMAYAGAYELHISVKPMTDLDTRFMAFCHDEQELIAVNGWLFTFEPIEE